jgi:predicted dehydrogenase
MTQRLRVAVVGGGIGTQHIEAYRKLPELYEVRAFCDIDAAKAKAVTERFGIPDDVGTFEEVLERADVDLVDICTPSSLHFVQSRAVLRAGKHVVSEKPIAGSLAEIDTLIAAERDSGRRGSPIFQYRFGNGFQKLLHLKAKGVLGRAYLGTVETHWKRGSAYYEVPWRGRWQTELGGCLVTHAVHAHDLLVTALGPVRSVFARTATRVNGIETEDCAVLALEMADGALVSLSVTLGSAAEISRLRLCFEALTCESCHEPYRPQGEPWQLWPADEAAKARIEEALADFGPGLEHYEGQFSRLHAALTEGGPPPVTLADSRASIELLTASYWSARSGANVTLPIGPEHPWYHGWRPRSGGRDG